MSLVDQVSISINNGGSTACAQHDGPVSLDNGGFEKIFRIEFLGDGVGGNVEPIHVVSEYLLITGSSADAFVLSDGESYAA